MKKIFLFAIMLMMFHLAVHNEYMTAQENLSEE